MNNGKCLSVCCFALAAGVLWGLSLWVIGLVAWLFGWGAAMVATMGSMYIGFGASLMGSLIGMVWGFIDGFIAGFIFAWLYNFFLRKCCKS